MRFAASVLGVAAVAGKAATPPVPPAAATAEKPWARCWGNQFVADICCSGAWGGSGCWEETRSFNSCCRPATSPAPPPPSAAVTQVVKGNCGKRLQHIAAALSPVRVARHFAEPVEAKVRRVLHGLSNFTGPYARRDGLLAPFLSGISPFEREMLLALVGLVAASLEARGMSFWLHGQALLGALRHHGPEPWAESVSLAVFAPAADDVTAALLAGARSALETHVQHSAFGPLVVTPAARKPSCRGDCGQWVVSFSRGLTFRSSSAEAGPRVPSVEVIWLDARGESPGWRRAYGQPLPRSHRELLALALPVVHGRPFAHIRLPVPRHAWEMAKVSLPGVTTDNSLLEVCRSSLVALPLPCAALSAVFPMVLLRRSFASSQELLKELGEVPGNGVAALSFGALRSLRRNALATARSSTGRPALELSVEVVADTVRGASVILFAEEVGGGSAGGPFTCALKIHGEHILVTGEGRT